jgi:hypothetical protein
MAPSVSVEVIPINVRDASEIERAVADFARSGNGGLIPTSSAVALRYRDLIITLAARHKLPAIYWERFFVTSGGLMSYGPDLIDNYRRAAGYVDRILKGEKPADLPVQTPTKYEMVFRCHQFCSSAPMNSSSECRDRYGTKRTSRVVPHMSAFGGRALTHKGDCDVQSSAEPHHSIPVLTARLLVMEYLRVCGSCACAK